jgi:ATP-dependent DNA helicase PIF1
LTDNNNISWSELYNQHREEIENESDLLSPPIDDLENEFNEKESKQEGDELDNEEHIRLDWMILSDMRPGVIMENSSDLGLRNIDINYDWTGDVRRRYPELNLADAPNFIQRARELGVVNSENIINCAANYHTLNDNQMKIFKRIESHYSTLIMNPGHVELLRLIVMGTAGTDKSYLINMIQDRLQEIARSHNNDTQSPVLVLAPTRVAAFNIHSIIIHSALSIPISSGNFKLNGDRLKKLQKKLEVIKYFIIDEKSMVGCRMLALIDMRLRQAFPEQQNQVFGGRSVILVGDFGQLTPVLDEPMYSQIPQCDPLLNDGITIYRQF